ncbi:ribosomal L7Ae/L30e/S12e/Gadd45 family protein [Candidatus Woesearchaeota archaeon]|nr:ribosomal L7Ae/L30e/S12e/Gadd45 family protein [Candidatus Woesearchaeota archaeon]
MAKKLTSTEIRKIIQSNDVIIGTEKTLKNLKLGKVDKVIASSNCSEKVFEDLEYYSDLSQAEVIKSNFSNEELGVMCKKPYSISVLSILKGV